MSYPIEVKICSKNAWFTPAESKSYYGSYSRHGVTVHWWGGGEDASQHDNIVNYFMGQAQAAIKSVNYVVSDNKITEMVDSDNVAWASESGNPVTVSIEFQPTLSDEGYKKGGWLISELEKKYGGLELYKHSFWFPTSCPGTIDINRLRQEANKAQGGGEMPLTPGQQDKLIKMSLHREPRPDELNNPDWANNPGLAIDALWNNGGEGLFKQKPSDAQAKLDQVKKIVNS